MQHSYRLLKLPLYKQMLQYQICKYIVKNKNLLNHIHLFQFKMPRKKLNSTTAKNRTNKRNPKTGQFDTKDDDEHMNLMKFIMKFYKNFFFMYFSIFTK
jgi:hypothetical protein